MSNNFLDSITKVQILYFFIDLFLDTHIIKKIFVSRNPAKRIRVFFAKKILIFLENKCKLRNTILKQISQIFVRWMKCVIVDVPFPALNVLKREKNIN